MISIERNAQSRTKLLLVSDITSDGGVSTHIRDLCSLVDPTRFDVSILLDTTASVDRIAVALGHLPVRVIRASLYPGYHEPGVITSAIQLVLDDVRPDVMHAHCGSPRGSLMAREAAISRCIPLIISEHYVGASHDYPAEILSRLRTTYAKAHSIVSCCDENMVLLQSIYGLRSNHHQVIFNGVALARPRHWAGASTCLRAICVARLDERKGIDNLLRAVAALKPKFSDRLSLSVAGDGPERERLQELATELGLAVNWMGWVTDVAQVLEQQDLFVLPSLSEGQPISLLEALAAGLPVIASAVSGIPQALRHGKFGALVPAGNVASLSEAIAQHVEAPEVLRGKAQSARSALIAEHDQARNAGKIFQLWADAAR